MLLARKITRPKWQTAVDGYDGYLPAHAVTFDCRVDFTNCLSLWAVNDDADELAMANVALAIGSSARDLAPIELVFIESEHITSAGIAVRKTPGRTPAIAVRDEHYDATDLEFGQLGVIAIGVVLAIRKELFRKYTVLDQEKLLRQAYTEGTLDTNELSPAIRARLE